MRLKTIIIVIVVILLLVAVKIFYLTEKKEDMPKGASERHKQQMSPGFL
jgi:flagellar basal body-associated protein FliL